MRANLSLGSLLLALAAGGCLQSASNVCADGTICPRDSTCLPSGGCAPTDLVQACQGKAAGDFCDFTNGEAGTCTDEYCVLAGCGNAIVEEGEACDDGNTQSLDEQLRPDSCAADCSSDQSCGNGTIDLAAQESCDDANAIAADGCPNTCSETSLTWFALPRTFARSNHEVVYDLGRSRVVAFGGQDLGFASTNTILEWDGAYFLDESPPAIEGAPLRQAGHAMAYDSARMHTLLYENATRRTWAYDGQAWELLHEATGFQGPPPLAFHAMSYDPARDVTVLFGGLGSTGSATWEWDGQSWEEMSPTVFPPARSHHTLIYHPGLGRCMLFGGEDVEKVSLNDTWLWDGQEWTRVVSSNSPPPRLEHAMAFEPTEDRVLLFGGRPARFADSTNDTWAFDGQDWTQLFPIDSPDPKVGHSMIYDYAKGVLTLYGGHFGNDGEKPSADIFIWQESKWKSVVQQGTEPSPRRGPSMTYEQDSGHILLFGGADEAVEPLGDTWRWTGNEWTQLAGLSPRPAARKFHSATYDPVRQRTILFGGFDGTTDALGDTWEWDGQSWTDVTPSQPLASPPARGRHAAVFDPFLGQVIIHGGGVDDRETALHNDLWAWTGSSWQELQPAGESPSARQDHTLSYDARRHKVVLFGGNELKVGAPQPPETWEWDGNTWADVTPLNLVHSPPTTMRHAAYFDPFHARVFIVGGFGGSVSSQSYEWDGQVWSERFPAGSQITASESMGSAYDPIRGRLMLFGGDDNVPQSAAPIGETRWIRWPGVGVETCTSSFDADGDGLVGCEDPDCFGRCSPGCSPLAQSCLQLPFCGDGDVSGVETCDSCPEDVGTCAPLCGNAKCEAGESVDDCPGDCL